MSPRSDIKERCLSISFHVRTEIVLRVTATLGIVGAVTSQNIDSFLNCVLLKASNPDGNERMPCIKLMLIELAILFRYIGICKLFANMIVITPGVCKSNVIIAKSCTAELIARLLCLCNIFKDAHENRALLLC